MLRADGFDARLQRLADVLVLVALGALVSTAISATVGVAALHLGGIASAATLGRTWRAWWLGDVMGDLLVAPLLLIAWARPPLRLRAHPVSEAGLSALAIAATVGFVFASRQPVLELHVPGYLLFPVLLIVTTRLGQYGASVANFLVAAAAIAFTASGYGPFVRSAGLSENLLQLQMFMGVLAITTLALGAAVAERDRAVQARDDFLSVASHELRTPLTSLMLQLQILPRTIGRDKDVPRERLLPAAKAALRQSQKLARLVDDLLDVSRITATRLDLDLEEIDLGTLVGEIAETYEEQSRRVGSVITVKTDGECKGWWDRQRLEQVIDNLVSNAVKYGRGKPVEVAVSSTPGGVLLSVRDHGIGVSLDDQRRIFDRFERAVSGQRYGGLGLGLWISRRIVEAHQGQIRVESTPGDGATFLVELQRERPAAMDKV